MKLKITVNITEKERAILNYAIEHCEGEILQPANDDKNYMGMLYLMYKQKLIILDFENDKLFVDKESDSIKTLQNRGLLCI